MANLCQILAFTFFTIAILVTGAPTEVKNELNSNAEKESSIPAAEIELEHLKAGKVVDSKPKPKSSQKELPTTSDNANSEKDSNSVEDWPKNDKNFPSQARFEQKRSMGLSSGASGSAMNRMQNPNFANNYYQFQDKISNLEPVDEPIHFDMSSMDYGPKDIAEYIFWTGDEDTVAGAVNDFLKEGIMTRKEASRFLEDVRRELNNLQMPFSGNSGEIDYNGNMPTFLSSNRRKKSQRMRKNRDLDSAGFSDVSIPHDLLSYLNMDPNMDVDLDREINHGGDSDDLIDELAMNHLLQEFDLKMTENTLQDIIYQLAKELFAREIELADLKPDLKSTRTIQNLMKSVEERANAGLLSKDLEKNVEEMLISGLVDAASEHGILKGFTAPTEANAEGQLKNNQIISKMSNNLQESQLQSLKIKKNLKAKSH